MLEVSLGQAEIGPKIQKARAAKRWKQKQLAAAVHVEPVTVSRWERGATTPDLDMLEQIAEALERPLSYFVTPAAGDVGERELRDELARRHDETMRRLDAIDEQLRVLSATTAEIRSRLE